MQPGKVLLVLACLLPLGVAVNRQHDHDFRDDALSSGRLIAAAAEERLVDKEPASGLTRALSAP